MTADFERSGGVDVRQDRQPWRDSSLPVAERVADLVGRMTLEEKAHQLVGFWAGPLVPGQPVVPMQDDFAGEASHVSLDTVLDGGLGQLTRVFGTEPLHPRDGVTRMADFQRRVIAGNRFGIPAIAHEECLTGLNAWTATIFPTPLAWGASFDDVLVEEMAAAIGSMMRKVGAHQGLAPVLDVTRDYRWGRTEETIGEDPYLVGIVGSAYARGLERSGIIATLKHFAGYSTSRAGRNHAPAALGPREFADVILEPFAIALRTSGARSVMHSYADVDGVPPAADETLLTALLRDELGFGGVVVSDYFGVSHLETVHGGAASPAGAAALALRAGVDVELPTVRCYGDPLVELVRDGTVPEDLVDRAVTRVLAHKCALGMLDEGWEDELTGLAAAGSALEHLDPPEHRDLARRLAEESVVLVANDGTLPLRPDVRQVALVGPLGDDPLGMLGCYTFPNHVLIDHPDTPLGVEIPTLADALRAELPQAAVKVVQGCGVNDAIGDVAEDIDAAVEAAGEAELCVLALGDRAGLWGRGTSGEGCDADSLALPGKQAELARRILATGTPTVIVLLSGRPYALTGLAGDAAAVVQAFFPGQEGAFAVAGVLSGRVDPSGRLPVSMPRNPGSQPGTYLHAPLGGRTKVSNIDPTPLFPFGHGLTFTEFSYGDLTVGDASGGGGTVPTDGTVQVTATVRNVGGRVGTEVAQLYLNDPVASTVRPVRWLAGWARVRLEPGEAATVTFTVHADRTSFTGRDHRRIVEPGEIGVTVGPSSGDLPLRGAFTLEGPARTLGPNRVLTTQVEVNVRER